MRTINILVYVETNRMGSKESEELQIEVEDNATDQEIEDKLEEEAKEWMYNHIQWGWDRINYDS